MIDTSVSPFVLEAGSDQAFNLSSILSEPTFQPLALAWSVRLHILSSTDSTPIHSFRMLITKAEADAKTGTGTGDTAKAYNAVEQVVVDKLEAIPENSTVVFTIT